MSFLLPFTTVIPVSLSRDIDASSQRSLARSLSRSTDSNSYPQFNEGGVDVVLHTPAKLGPPPRRKGSWINKPNPERRQSCRRVNSRRDWSEELEESEYHLPFHVAPEETERGGGRTPARRMVSFLDEVDEDGGGSYLPRLDASFAGQGLMIDVESSSPREAEGSTVGTESNSGLESMDTDISVTDSEWTAFSEEAEGIEMFF